MNKLTLILFCLLPFYLMAQAQFTTQDFKSLEDSIQKIMDQKKIPGVQIAIVNKDSILWNGNLGYADIKNQIPVTNETMFRIGSTSKSFVAISAMQLIEQGKLSLEDELKVVAPEVPFENLWEETNPIKLKHLLEHTTGFDDLRLRDYATNAENWTTLQGLEYHPESRVSRWEPGMYMSYCNTGPGIAAFMIEKKSMLTIEDYVKQNIFTPLEMVHSDYLLSDYVRKNLSKAYISAEYEEAPYWHIVDRAAGSINTTALEMGNYIRMLLNKGMHDSIQIISPESIERMQQAQTTLSAKAGLDEGYGCYLYSKQHKGIKMYAHNGGMQGFLNSMIYIPELGLGFNFTINNSGVGGLGDIEKIILNFLIPEEMVKTAADFKTDATISPEMMGWYRSTTSRMQMMRMADWLSNGFSLSEKDGKYFYKPLFGDSHEVYPVKENVLLYESKISHNSTSLILLKDQQGNTIIQMPNYSGNFMKSSVIKIWGPIGIGILCIALMISALVASLIWIPKQIFSKTKIRNIKTRIWPLITVLFMIGLLITFMLVGNLDAINRLGHLSWWSFGLFAFSILFAVSSIITFAIALFSFGIKMNKAARIHQFLIASACLTITLFFIHWDIIGLMTWVY
ncbi:MAG: serine hydrolase [Bacteroidales bacterium]|nr:serine hydrolase [Bacteroidales bacterium]